MSMLLLMLLLLLFSQCNTQLSALDERAALYDERGDGSEQLKDALARVKKEEELWLVQVGRVLHWVTNNSIKR